MGKGFLVPVRSTRLAVVEPIELGQSGADFVQSRLVDGGPLACSVADLWQGQGFCFAPLEKGATLERAQGFDTGTSEPTDAIRKWLADYISSHWGDNAQLVFEDPWRKPSDFENHPERGPDFFIGETPYFMPSDQGVLDKIMTGEKRTMSWHYSMFVVPASQKSFASRFMTKSDADVLARNVQAALVSAYDNEGYVVWKK